MSYTYSDLYSEVNSRLHNKIARIADPRSSINTGVRKAVGVPLKTLRRTYPVPIRLLDEVYSYTAPSDIQGHKIIDLNPIAKVRSSRFEWNNVHPSLFERYKSSGRAILCVTSNGSQRILKANVSGNENSTVISELDSITDGGTWTAVGTASDLETDSTTFLHGNGSVKFDIGAGTQDGIDIALTSASDIEKYIADGSVYVSVSLPSTSGVTGVTVRLGSSSSAYLECSVTSDISGNNITSGFNTFRLKLSDGTETGTPDYENIDYAAVLIDKDTTTLTGVRVDKLMVGAGTQHILDYYSRFGWQSASGTWKENSTLDTDVLNAEQEEFDLVAEYCFIECAKAAREYQDIDKKELEVMRRKYLMNNTDCSIRMVNDFYNISSMKNYGRN
jgi:hypothetical protein